MRRNRYWLAVGWLAAVLLVISIEPSLGNAGQAAGRSEISQASADSIPPEQFLTSPFAERFRAGDYPRALQAIEVLERAYPRDALIMRYHAMVLDRLGREEEAIALYRRLLERDPSHAPTRFFLGQAYAHRGDHEAAIHEWRWVLEHSPVEEYRQLAREQLAQPSAAARLAPTIKRFSLVGDIGINYDSNPLLKPSDKELAVAGNEQQAERFSVNATLGYRAVTKPETRLDLLSTTRQSLHDRGLDEVNFTSQELAVDGRHRTSLGGREVTVGSRYELLGGFLDGNLFSLVNRLLLSTDWRFTPQTRTYAYDRCSASNFGPDGSNPPQTSRDGVYNDVGITQYFYTRDFRRYVYAGQEFNLAQTRGSNFTRRGTSTRLGVHTPAPLVQKTDLDLSGGFAFSAYPRFASLSSLDPERRRDATWDLLASVTHYWTPQLATRLYYGFISANNRNDFFQYDRHLTGVQLLFSQSF